VRGRVRIELDDAGGRQEITGALRAAGLEVAEPGEPAGRSQAWIVEFPGEQGSGRSRLRAASSERRRPAVLALCRPGAIEFAVEALKEGADEFVLAPVELAELLLKTERALELRELRATDSPGLPPARLPEAELSGSSAAIARVREQVSRAAPGRATVLLTGETGTGKELAAKAIHGASPRAHGPLVKLNCAALPDPLLESELFGHERGAFTGAEQRRIGRFEEAHRGTLFLDEIGDMHPRTQAKVLRVLQEQEFERLGGIRTIRVDVRIIAATNQDLSALIEARAFREDLFFHLNVVRIELPPLRERRADIPVLAERFLAEFCGQRSCELSPEALAGLLAYPWPGNVRELRNVLERAALMGDAARIELRDLALPRASAAPAAESSQDAGAAPLVRLPPGGVDLRDVERELLLQALERSGWVQKEAARLLRMSRRKLNYRIRLLGIRHPSWRRNRGFSPGHSDVD
jgi:DNA-binding NtrC family response regulator